MMIAHHTVGHDGDDEDHDAEASNGVYDDHFKSYDDDYDGTTTHHTVGHDGDDDDPFKGRPRDKPDKESPEEKILLVFAYSSSSSSVSTSPSSLS